MQIANCKLCWILRIMNYEIGVGFHVIDPWCMHALSIFGYMTQSPSIETGWRRSADTVVWWCMRFTLKCKAIRNASTLLRNPRVIHLTNNKFWTFTSCWLITILKIMPLKWRFLGNYCNIAVLIGISDLPSRATCFYQENVLQRSGYCSDTYCIFCCTLRTKLEKSF